MFSAQHGIIRLPAASIWTQLMQHRSHQVAFEAYEVDPHEDCSAGVAAQSFNPVHQVGAELVASLQNTQHHDVVVPQVIHDVSGQTFRPVRNTRSKRSVSTHMSSLMFARWHLALKAKQNLMGFSGGLAQKLTVSKQCTAWRRLDINIIYIKNNSTGHVIF